MKKRKKEPIKRCAIGGQAVLEGVMMKSPTAVAMAVRRADGEIETSYTPYQSKAKKGTVLGWPIIRGVVIFIESLVNGMENITKSAELYGEEAFQEEPSKFEKWLAEKTGKSAGSMDCTEKQAAGEILFEENRRIAWHILAKIYSN